MEGCRVVLERAAVKQSWQCAVSNEGKKHAVDGVNPTWRRSEEGERMGLVPPVQKWKRQGFSVTVMRRTRAGARSAGKNSSAWPIIWFAFGRFRTCWSMTESSIESCIEGNGRSVQGVNGRSCRREITTAYGARIWGDEICAVYAGGDGAAATGMGMNSWQLGESGGIMEEVLLQSILKKNYFVTYLVLHAPSSFGPGDLVDMCKQFLMKRWRVQICQEILPKVPSLT